MCPYCGAALYGRYCSRCGRRSPDGQLAPNLFAMPMPFAHDDLMRIVLLLAAGLVLFIVPALGALTALAYLIIALRDAPTIGNATPSGVQDSTR